MATFFTLDHEFGSNNFASWVNATTGAGPFVGIDNPSGLHFVSFDFVRSTDDELIVPIALAAGQTISIDIDFGYMDFYGDLYSQIALIRADGRQVAFDGNGTIAVEPWSGRVIDAGSGTDWYYWHYTPDPRMTFTAVEAGVYYVAVTSSGNNYINDTFNFENDGGYPFRSVAEKVRT